MNFFSAHLEPNVFTLSFVNNNMHNAYLLNKVHNYPETQLHYTLFFFKQHTI